MKKQGFHPDRIPDYFRLEWYPLLLVTVTGLFYNIGLLATPWFEGKLAECLLRVLQGNAGATDMLRLAGAYVLIISLVQLARYIKRFYVRRFSNDVNRRMKQVLYANLLNLSGPELQKEGTGNLITKAISDVDDCAEGMRKFTTEIFDTGIALAAYLVMLLCYDWRLTLICMIFPPISYYIAEKMKAPVQEAGADMKNKAGKLNASALDRSSNSILYRVYGCEGRKNSEMERELGEYEKAAVRANVRVAALPPLYQVISMVSVIFILYFGAANVRGSGNAVWTIASFTTYLSCYSKLSVKSSKAAKLFNSVHKAQVSWDRIKGLMTVPEETAETCPLPSGELLVDKLSFAYPNGKTIINDISFSLKPGEIMGVTGPVACGKSTLGKVFLCEYPYKGSVRYCNRELREMPQNERRRLVSYLGHDPEILNDSIENNILLGKNDDAEKYLKLVAFYSETAAMENGPATVVGNGGVRLSGGQAQRLGLARTLCHARPLFVLDDPFSALDRSTENEVFDNLISASRDSSVILISHRLHVFPRLTKILWMETDGSWYLGSHEQLLERVPEYARLYSAQEGGDRNAE